jgi:hypothetical protein
MPDFRVAENPFFVLGLAPDSDAMAAQREGKKLIAQLEMGIQSAKTYKTPFGERERTPELVREAVALLATPEKRVLFELWASATPIGEEELKAEATRMVKNRSDHCDRVLSYFRLGSWSR